MDLNFQLDKLISIIDSINSQKFVALIFSDTRLDLMIDLYASIDMITNFIIIRFN